MRKLMQVIDHTTGTTYPSMSKAAPALYVSYPTLIQYRQRYGLRFDLYGHDIQLIESEYPVNCCALRCIETGCVYCSYGEVAKAVGVSISALQKHLYGKIKTVKKMHFERVFSW